MQRCTGYIKLIRGSLYGIGCDVQYLNIFIVYYILAKLLYHCYKHELLM